MRFSTHRSIDIQLNMYVSFHILVYGPRLPFICSLVWGEMECKYSQMVFYECNIVVLLVVFVALC